MRMPWKKRLYPMAAGQGIRRIHAWWARWATPSGSLIRLFATKLKTGGISKPTMKTVIIVFNPYVKFLSFKKESLSSTMAVDALMIIIIGASTKMAKAKATP
jgi:hypothetical protein